MKYEPHYLISAPQRGKSGLLCLEQEDLENKKE